MADRRWRRAGDLAVFCALAALAVAGALVGVHDGGDQARAWGACAAEFASLAALAFRRHRPLPVLAATAAFALAAAVIADKSTVGPLLPAIALYTVGAAASWRVTAAAATAVVTAYGAVAAASAIPPSSSRPS